MQVAVLVIVLLLNAAAQGLYVGSFGLVYRDATTVICAEGSNTTGFLPATLCNNTSGDGDDAVPPSFSAVATSNFDFIANFTYVTINAAIGCTPGNCTTTTINSAIADRSTCSWALTVDCSTNCTPDIDSNNWLTAGGGVVCGDDAAIAQDFKRQACTKRFPNLLAVDFFAELNVLSAPSAPMFYTRLLRAIDFQDTFFSFCSSAVAVPPSNACSTGPVNISCLEKKPNETKASLSSSGVVEVGSPTTVVCADATYFRAGMADVLCAESSSATSIAPVFKAVPILDLFSPSEEADLSFRVFNTTCQTKECSAAEMFGSAENFNEDCHNVLVVQCSRTCGISKSDQLATFSDSLLCADTDVQVLLDAFCAVNGSSSDFFAFTLIGPSPSTFSKPFIQLTEPFTSTTGTAEDFKAYCFESAYFSPTPCQTSVYFMCQREIDCYATINSANHMLQLEPATAFPFDIDTTYFDDQMRDTFCSTQIDKFPKSAIYKRPIPPSESILKWYGVSSTGCEYIVCDAKKVCNLAFQAAPAKQALALACNVSFEYKLYPETSALPLPTSWAESHYVGTLAVRPILPEPYAWSGVVGESDSFTDTLALLFCQRLFPEANFTEADALLSYGTAMKVEITHLKCNLPRNNTASLDPLNDPSICSFAFVQRQYYKDYPAGDFHYAVGLHCGHSACTRYSKYEIVGVFCGVGAFAKAKRNVWLSLLPNGTSIIHFLNASLQPWQQTPLASALFNLTGYNCRMDLLSPTDWSSFFELSASTNVEVTLSEKAQPSGYGQVTTVTVAYDGKYEYFMSCNSCPSTSPDGTYCGSALYTLRHDSVTNADVFDYYENPESPSPACTGIPFLASSSLPSAACVLQYQTSLCPALINQRIFGLAFSVEHSTLYELGKNGEIISKPYVLCAKPEHIDCPTSMNNSYCGTGIYSNASLRVMFSNDKTMEIFFESTDKQCSGMAYEVRPIARTVGCIVDIPAFTEYSSCLRNTALFGKAQGKQPVIISPDRSQLIFNFLDDTVYLQVCRNCMPDFSATYCSVQGTRTVQFLSPSLYNLVDYVKEGGRGFESAMDSDSADVCGPIMFQPTAYTGPTETLPPSLMPNSTTTSLSVYGVFEASFVIDEFQLLTPTEFVQKHSVAGGSRNLGDTFRLCSTITIPKTRFCPAGALTFEFNVIDELHMDVYLENGKVINTTYMLLPNFLINITSATALTELVEGIPEMRHLNYVAYAMTENGAEIFFSVYNFGYSRFLPCTTKSVLMYILWAIIGVSGFGLLAFLIKANVNKIRSLSSLKDMSEETEFLKSLEAAQSQDKDVELHELKELEELRRRDEDYEN